MLGTSRRTLQAHSIHRASKSQPSPQHGLDSPKRQWSPCKNPPFNPGFFLNPQRAHLDPFHELSHSRGWIPAQACSCSQSQQHGTCWCRLFSTFLLHLPTSSPCTKHPSLLAFRKHDEGRERPSASPSILLGPNLPGLLLVPFSAFPPFPALFPSLDALQRFQCFKHTFFYPFLKNPLV